LFVIVVKRFFVVSFAVFVVFVVIVVIICSFVGLRSFVGIVDGFVVENEFDGSKLVVQEVLNFVCLDGVEQRVV